MDSLHTSLVDDGGPMIPRTKSLYELQKRRVLIENISEIVYDVFMCRIHLFSFFRSRMKRRVR